MHSSEVVSGVAEVPAFAAAPAKDGRVKGGPAGSGNLVRRDLGTITDRSVPDPTAVTSRRLRHSRSAPEGPAGSSGTSRTIGRTQDTNRLNGVSWRPYWALRYRSTQLDDSAVATSTRAQLDSFVNGESNFGTNVVVWYAGHFTPRARGACARLRHRRPDAQAGPLVGRKG